MGEASQFDLVWLGLLIGIYDLGDRDEGIRALVHHLKDIGLTATRDRLLAEEEVQQLQSELRSLGIPVTETRLPDEHNRLMGNFESEDIANWVADELRQTSTTGDHPPRINISDTTDLINSMRPGVFAYLPQGAQHDFVEAEKSIRNGQLRGAALLLGACVESTVNHFYECILPAGESNIRHLCT